MPLLPRSMGEKEGKLGPVFSCTVLSCVLQLHPVGKKVFQTDLVQLSEKVNVKVPIYN